jgi:hypothetical protein
MHCQGFYLVQLASFRFDQPYPNCVLCDVYVCVSLPLCLTGVLRTGLKKEMLRWKGKRRNNKGWCVGEAENGGWVIWQQNLYQSFICDASLVSEPVYIRNLADSRINISFENLTQATTPSACRVSCVLRAVSISTSTEIQFNTAICKELS